MTYSAQNRKATPARMANQDNAHVNYKRFPAFGKQLLQLRLAGKIPEKSVDVVFDWNLGRNKCFLRIVLADEVPPSELELRYLAGLDVRIAYQEKDASRVPDLVQAVLAVNPRSVLALAIHLEKFFVFKNLAGEVLL